MDLYNSKRVHGRKRLSSTEERFFGVPPRAPSLQNSNPVELTEDEVLFSNYDSNEPSSSSSSSPIPTPIHQNHHHYHHNQHHKISPHSFGILAALPENEVSPNSENGSQFFHKAPISVSLSASLSSSSSSSSSRPFLSIPRIPSDRNLSSMPSLRFHQSAPVNIPMMSPAMVRAAKKFEEEEAKKIEELEDEEMVMPPHEFVTKKSVMKTALSPMLSYSLMEGVGRTLKGRDMRQVRNAVLRQSGFFD